MKKIILLPWLIILLCFSHYSFAQWVQIGPNAATAGPPIINSLYVMGDTLWASNSVFGAHYSTDYGQTWCETGLITGNVKAVAKVGPIMISASSSNIMYSSNSGIDFGGTSQSGSMLDAEMNGDLAIVGSTIGIFTSTNLGYAWSRNVTSGTYSSVAVSGGVMFAGNSSGVYKSTNRGSSFSTTLSPRDVNSITVCGTYIYVCSNSGIDYSTDNGVTWNLFSNAYSFKEITQKGSSFYAVSSTNIYKSTNNGANWNISYTGSTPITDLVSDSNNLFALINNELYRSSDNGASWVNYPYRFMQAYAVHKTPTSLLSSTSNAAIYRSINNGSNWINYSGGVNHVRCFAVNGSTIYAGNSPYDGGMALSTNDGVNWSSSGFGSYATYAIIADGPNLLTATYQYGVWYKQSAGGTWFQSGGSLQGSTVYCLAAKDSLCFAGALGRGIYRSTNAGYSFDGVYNYTQSVGSIVISGDYVFAGTSTGILISTNKGINWSVNSFPYPNVNALAVSGNNIFAGTEKNGVFISQDLGQTWRNINGNLGKRLSVNKLYVSGNDLYCAAYTTSIMKAPISTLVRTESVSTVIPKDFYLSQNYPNPFNPVTQINYELRNTNYVSLKVYDVNGNEVAELVNERKIAGSYSVSFDAAKYNLSSGVYFYKLSTENFEEVKRMVLVK